VSRACRSRSRSPGRLVSFARYELASRQLRAPTAGGRFNAKTPRAREGAWPISYTLLSPCFFILFFKFGRWLVRSGGDAGHTI
jgi:hypothetical protein